MRHFTLFPQDPSVRKATQALPPALEEYNPFTDAKPVSTLCVQPVDHVSTVIDLERQIDSCLHDGEGLRGEVILDASLFSFSA